MHVGQWSTAHSGQTGHPVRPDDVRAPARGVQIAVRRQVEHVDGRDVFDGDVTAGAFEGAAPADGVGASSSENNMHAVFRRYLTEGKPGYVEHRWAKLGDAVRWLGFVPDRHHNNRPREQQKGTGSCSCSRGPGCAAR